MAAAAVTGLEVGIDAMLACWVVGLEGVVVVSVPLPVVCHSLLLIDGVYTPSESQRPHYIHGT